MRMYHKYKLKLKLNRKLHKEKKNPLKRIKENVNVTRNSRDHFPLYSTCKGYMNTYPGPPQVSP